MMGMSEQTIVWKPQKLPPLPMTVWQAEETAEVNALFKGVRSPRRRLNIAVDVILAATGQSDVDGERGHQHEMLRRRRNELITWLRLTADQAGVRNINLPAASATFYTHTHGIVVDAVASGATLDTIDPGDDPVGEMQALAEQVYRAAAREKAAIKHRDDAIVKLAQAGFERSEVHRMLRGTAVGSRLSQIAAAHGVSFKE